VESLPCFAEALSAVEGEVEGDLLSGFPDIFDYYFDPTAWGSFRHYLNGEAGPVEIESQWTAEGEKCFLLTSPFIEPAPLSVQTVLRLQLGFASMGKDYAPAWVRYRNQP